MGLAENISNSHFVHDDDDSSASLSTEKNTTKLVHFSMPWLLPGASCCLFVWIPAVKKYHSQCGDHTISNTRTDFGFDDQLRDKLFATLRGKVLCSDPSLRMYRMRTYAFRLRLCCIVLLTSIFCS